MTITILIEVKYAAANRTQGGAAVAAVANAKGEALALVRRIAADLSALANSHARVVLLDTMTDTTIAVAEAGE